MLKSKPKPPDENAGPEKPKPDAGLETRRRSDGMVQSVDRALLLLERLAQRGGKAGLSDLARDLDLNRSTVHGLLATMLKHGVVGQDASRNYVLGIRLFELGNQAVLRLDLRTAAAPFLQQLVDEFQETVHLVVRDGAYVVYIDKRESSRSMQIVSQIGQRLPAYCTAVGKAMLAYLPEPRLDQLLAEIELVPMTPNTITDRGALKRHLQRVCQQGYALDREEIIEGLRCVGGPIWDYSNLVIGALSISGPSVRMDAEKLERGIRAVLQATAEISHQLGYRG